MLLKPEKSPLALIKENPDFQPLSDLSAIEAIIAQVVAEQPESVVDFRNGKERAFGFLVGQAMKLCKGKADPKVVNELLKKKLS